SPSPRYPSDIVCLGGAQPGQSRFLPPTPARDLGHIVAVPRDVLLMLDELVAYSLLGIRSPRPQLRHAIDHVAYQVKAIEIIQYAHVERGRGGALFLVTAHVDVVVACAPVGQSVDEPWIAMERKNDRFVDSK